MKSLEEAAAQRLARKIAAVGALGYDFDLLDQLHALKAYNDLVTDYERINRLRGPIVPASDDLVNVLKIAVERSKSMAQVTSESKPVVGNAEFFKAQY